jgi:dolichol-phosphate mannosyltransferase
LQLSTLSIELELIFIDDGSGDSSFNELLRIHELRPQTRLVKLSRNFGAVHASKYGMQFVTGSCFMILAADLQDPPELIIEMAQKWLDGSKFTICERASREDPILSKIFAYIFYWLLRNLVIHNYPRRGFDMALMDVSMLPFLRDSSKNLYTPLLAFWLGFKPNVIVYHRTKREHGKSRWTFSKKFNAFLDIMLGFSVKPIRLISLTGFVIALFSFMYGALITTSALLGTISVPGFATIAALVTFLLGLIIIMLGVIGEYLWRIFDEINKRPEVVADEIY